MKRTTVHNLIIVDASGSMSSIYNQALTGINETIQTIYLVDQHDPYVAQSITLLSFANGDEKLQYIYRNEDPEMVRPVTEKDYVLRGSTALYDAIGDAVTGLKKHVGKEDKALVTIITDGYENDSRRWTGPQVKRLIEHLRGKGWVFTYIGANQDVEAEAGKIGMVNSMKFEATIEGTVEMFKKEGNYRRRWNERVSRGEDHLDEGYFHEEPFQIPADRITPERIDHLAAHEVFVFGSNVYGRHDGGAARAALHRFGAKYGVAEGPQGQSYAIPTVGLRPEETAMAIHRFINTARLNPGQKYLVTPIGCGNGGWDAADMAPLFTEAKDVPNISLPRLFWAYLS